MLGKGSTCDAERAGSFADWMKGPATVGCSTKLIRSRAWQISAVRSARAASRAGRTTT